MLGRGRPASIWQRPTLKSALGAVPGAYSMALDQCQFGADYPKAHPDCVQPASASREGLLKVAADQRRRRVRRSFTSQLRPLTSTAPSSRRGRQVVYYDDDTIPS